MFGKIALIWIRIVNAWHAFWHLTAGRKYKIAWFSFMTALSILGVMQLQTLLTNLLVNEYHRFL